MKNLDALRREAAAVAAAISHAKVSVDAAGIYSKSVTNGSNNCSTGNCGSSSCTSV